MQKLVPFEIEPLPGRRAMAVRVAADVSPADVASALALPRPNRVLMLSAGAGLMSGEAVIRLKRLFLALGQALTQEGVCVIDGGTASGGMALMGESLAAAGNTPNIGVLPALAPVDDHGTRAEDILEPNHSHFVLLQKDEWGSEIPMMSGLTSHLSSGAAAVTLLVNGGQIALHDVEESLRAGRKVIAVAGSGRLADDIACTVRGETRRIDERVSKIGLSGQVTVFDLSRPPEDLITLLFKRLT